MFESTGSATQPVAVQLSAWQWFKAGAAFTAGAILVASTLGMVWGIFVARFWTEVMLRAVQQIVGR